jgi:hypothetical protein
LELEIAKMPFDALSGMSPVQNVRDLPGPYPHSDPPSPYVAMLFVRFYAESKRVISDVTANSVT